MEAIQEGPCHPVSEDRSRENADQPGAQEAAGGAAGAPGPAGQASGPAPVWAQLAGEQAEEALGGAMDWAASGEQALAKATLEESSGPSPGGGGPGNPARRALHGHQAAEHAYRSRQGASPGENRSQIAEPQAATLHIQNDSAGRAIMSAHREPGASGAAAAAVSGAVSSPLSAAAAPGPVPRQLSLPSRGGVQRGESADGFPLSAAANGSTAQQLPPGAGHHAGELSEGAGERACSMEASLQGKSDAYGSGSVPREDLVMHGSAPAEPQGNPPHGFPGPSSRSGVRQSDGEGEEPTSGRVGHHDAGHAAASVISMNPRAARQVFCLKLSCLL